MSTRSIDYDLLLRDLARLEPRYGFSASDITLTNAQAATVVREFPDVVAEAIAGHEAEIAQAMEQVDSSTTKAGLRFDLLYAGTSARLFTLIRERCASYIVQDLREMCEQVGAEDREEDAYTKGGVLA